MSVEITSDVKIQNADYRFSKLWVAQKYVSIIIAIIISAVVYFFIMRTIWVVLCHI